MRALSALSIRPLGERNKICYTSIIMAEQDQISDKDLMARIRDGDHQAFSILVHRHTNMFYGAAYRLCQHVQEAEDVVQDAFIKLWQKPESWDASRNVKFTTWFYKVVTNLALDSLRKRKNTTGGDALDAMADQTPSQEQTLQNAQEEDLLEVAIEALPERQKIALNLCFYEGLSNKEAAEVMDVNVKALESLLMRAKAGLKDHLQRTGKREDERREGHG